MRSPHPRQFWPVLAQVQADIQVRLHFRQLNAPKRRWSSGTVLRCTDLSCVRSAAAGAVTVSGVVVSLMGGVDWTYIMLRAGAGAVKLADQDRWYPSKSSVDLAFTKRLDFDQNKFTTEIAYYILDITYYILLTFVRFSHTGSHISLGLFIYCFNTDDASFAIYRDKKRY